MDFAFREVFEVTTGLYVPSSVPTSMGISVTSSVPGQHGDFLRYEQR
ncbi:hypothetical protein M3182_21305 [Mesobacillus maritimus]|nr:hypothetical protein [Mesobacillus maritimus]MCM3588244.1 hypothetical protein [Mesobacillus maritimus]